MENISQKQEKYVKEQHSQIELYVQDHCILNETVFTEVDLSDSDYSSDEDEESSSQTDSVIEEQSNSGSSSSSSSSSTSDNEQKEQQQQNNQRVSTQDSYDITKNNYKQKKSILSNKHQVFNYQSTLKEFDDVSEQTPSIADMVFDDNKKKDDEQAPGTGIKQVESFFSKSMKKNSTIKFEEDIKNNTIINYTGYDTINLDEKDQTTTHHEKKKSPQLQPQNFIKDMDNQIPLSKSEAPPMTKKQTLKSSMSVKFKLPHASNQHMHKGKSLSQAEPILMKKQSTIKKDQRKAQNSGKSKFFYMEENKGKQNQGDKSENILQIKKQNKYLQKFISLIKSNSINKIKTPSNADSSKNMRSLKSIIPSDNINLNRFFSQNRDSDLITQTTLKESEPQSFFSGDKKEQIGQKIKAHMLKLQDGFQQIQEQLFQYNNYIQATSNADPIQIRFNQLDMQQFQEEFEKMKHFDIYFPQNNYSKVIQHYSEVQHSFKRRMYRLKKKSQTPKERQPRLSYRYNIRKIYSHVQ